MPFPRGLLAKSIELPEDISLNQLSSCIARPCWWKMAFIKSLMLTPFEQPTNLVSLFDISCVLTDSSSSRRKITITLMAFKKNLP
ncbi:hypothetical protein VNO77_04390 [Canavalia gladiata]|uniref:Uncharacterized protein n=1 Tax=Canavalia gladiata TaxID=3824 RepID=A0AAN9MWF3_CANGL